MNREKQVGREASLSENFNKARSKTVFSSTVCLLAIVYTVAPGTSFLGIKLEGMTDYNVELITIISAAFFFLNASMRFIVDQVEYRDIKPNIDQYQSDLQSSISMLNDELTRLSGLLASSNAQQIVTFFGDTSPKLAKITREILPALDEISKLEQRYKQNGKLQNEVAPMLAMAFEKFLPHHRDLTACANELNSLVDSVSFGNQEESHLVSQFKKSSTNIEKTQLVLAKLLSNVSKLRTFRRVAGLRVILFDIIVPTALFIGCIILYFSPAIKAIVTQLINSPISIHP